MAIWRPADMIVVKALALVWQDDALLLADVKDDHGRVTGMRPLGGTVEFGEPWKDALQREFLEELGARLTLLDNHLVMENIFEHKGRSHHEVVFLCHAHFTDARFYQSEDLVVREDDEPTSTATWVTFDELDARQLDLYPLGLRDRLGQPEKPQFSSRRFS